MRKIAIVIGVVVGIGLLALASVWFLMDPNRYRDAIRARLEPQLGRQVTLGEIVLGLIPSVSRFRHWPSQTIPASRNNLFFERKAWIFVSLCSHY